ncbi:bifunctional serine/threonine-protein kinase/formylglycine-generating enzyme family protein [Haliangium sp.]|uniref:bifunctional serine/threonine-protein kinase/formylglycine-generating enzyme family protein n=1 Tax=Haliangium sp. TaxID=2663208 RepID=UPI003D13014F
MNAQVLEQSASFPPERIERYRRGQYLGTGAFGQVHLYHDELLDRPVAIKFVRCGDPDEYRRILEEARLAAAAQHPGVAIIHHFGRLDDEWAFIISEFIVGTPLSQCAPLPWPRVREVGRDLARALAAIHRNGVLHRDVKPSNIVASEGGLRPKLIDFGLAARVPDHDCSGARESTGEISGERGGFYGTIPYMAPEIWTEQVFTVGTEIYALGATLYELCTGRPPPAAFQPEPVPRLDEQLTAIDPRFANIVHRCLARAPGDRFDSCDAVYEALEDSLRREGRAALPAGNPYRGLRAFEAEHRELFFGRGADIRAVIDRLRARRFLLLAGESGVGKSSLARAGVLPRLAEGEIEARRSWRVRVFTPGQQPARALGQMLSACIEADSATEAAIVEEVLEHHVSAIHQRLRAHHGLDKGTILFVDQLEELVTVGERGQAEAIARLLAGLAGRQTPGLLIVATARSDQLTRLAELPGLGDMLQPSLYLVRPLGERAIRETVVRPAEAVGLGFEDEAMVDELVAAAAGAEGGLPLLQFALEALWERRDQDGGVMTRRAFEEIGGVAGALSRHAEQVLADLHADTRAAVRRIMLDLVTAQGTKQRCTESELDVGPHTARALASLVEGRLLVARRVEGEPAYELAHEALITQWKTLRDWLQEESGHRSLRASLSLAAAEWRRMGSPGGEGLWGARRLEAARALAALSLSADERAFLDTSRRIRRRARWRWSTLTAVAVALAASAYGASQWQVAGKVGGHLQAAAAALDEAQRLRHGFDEVRAATYAQVRAGGRDAGEGLWQRALALGPAADAAYGDAIGSLDAAFVLDPDRDDVRALLVTALDERARLADALGLTDERDELLARAAVYDPERVASWKAPVSVRVVTSPAQAVVSVVSYRPGKDGGLVSEESGAGAAPFDIALPPGSYLVIVHEDDVHAEVRYPFVVGRDVGARTVALDRPLRDHIPPGMVYVAPGVSRIGHGQGRRGEFFRQWGNAAPRHERGFEAFLIARHETTFGDWIEFLDACTLMACGDIKRHYPVAHADLRGGIPMRLERTAEGVWTLVVAFPESEAPARFAQGHALVYPHRARGAEQRWERMPVVGVSTASVAAYLAWLDADGRVPGARLCTSEEWERAARGADGRQYPHGDRLAPGDANFDETYGQDVSLLGPDEVGAYPASMSPFGVYDLAGSVWELVRGDDDAPFVIRGGAYYQDRWTAALVNREASPLGDTEGHALVGVRVCASLPSAGVTGRGRGRSTLR